MLNQLMNSGTQVCTQMICVPIALRKLDDPTAGHLGGICLPLDIALVIIIGTPNRLDPGIAKVKAYQRLAMIL